MVLALAIPLVPALASCQVEVTGPAVTEWEYHDNQGRHHRGKYVHPYQGKPGRLETEGTDSWNEYRIGF